MQLQSSRFAVIFLVAAVVFLGTLAFAGSADAIFYPCRDTCDNASGTARCSYYQGDGTCPAFPNPCYMTCAKYLSCTISPYPVTDHSEADDKVVFGQDFGSWLETMAHNYGPCLELVPFEGSAEVVETAPFLQQIDESNEEGRSDQDR